MFLSSSFVKNCFRVVNFLVLDCLKKCFFGPKRRETGVCHQSVINRLFVFFFFFFFFSHTPTSTLKREGKDYSYRKERRELKREEKKRP